MIDILQINKKLKRNKFVSFVCTENDYELADKFEDLLFNHGYKWFSSGTNKFVKVYMKSTRLRYTYYIFELNHHNVGGGIITLTITQDQYTYEDSYNLSNYILNNLFVSRPNYKPKKIERII